MLDVRSFSARQRERIRRKQIFQITLTEKLVPNIQDFLLVRFVFVSFLKISLSHKTFFLEEMKDFLVGSLL